MAFLVLLLWLGGFGALFGGPGGIVGRVGLTVGGCGLKVPRNGLKWRAASGPSRRRGVMKSFLGEHQHSLDVKGRLILPADFRGPLADGAVIGPGQQECLVVFTLEEWGKGAERLETPLADGWGLADP